MAKKATSKPTTDQVTVEQVKSITAPYGNPTIIENVANGLNEWADKLGLNTPLRKAHFLAQIAHESDHFKTTKEYGGAQTRYAPWYGRGLIQTTWQENYRDFTAWCKSKGIDCPDFATAENRDKVAMFPWAFLSAVSYWDQHNLNASADADNVREVTKKINGGYNGLADRIKYLNIAKKIFGIDPAVNDVDPGTVVAKTSVKDIQEALVKNGFKLVVDGRLGKQTLAALTMFQKINGLVPDGIVGGKTSKALFG